MANNKKAPTGPWKHRQRHHGPTSSSQSPAEGDNGSSISSTATSGIDKSTLAKNHKLHTNSYSWKSSSTKMANEFNRVQRLVKYIAPEQFKNPARPSNGPCRIMPISLAEYVEHTQEILNMRAKELSRGIEVMKERAESMKKADVVQPPIRSQLGKDAKVYKDGLSPVLCKPSIWCEEYKVWNFEEARWPTQSELQECGDKGANDRVELRCRRSLPPPRQLTSFLLIHTEFTAMLPTASVSAIKHFSFFDEQGPTFQQGPSPTEIIKGNDQVNNDATFEKTGSMWLGKDIMSWIGH